MVEVLTRTTFLSAWPLVLLCPSVLSSFVVLLLQGNPPDHMCLAVAQAILACLKCGWDAKRGTSLLRPALCNDQQEGDVSVTKCVPLPSLSFRMPSVQ